MHTIDAIIFDLGNVLIPWDPRRLYRSVFADQEEMEYFLAHVCTPAWNTQQDAGYPIAAAAKERIAAFPHYAEQIGAYYARWEEMLGEAIEESVELLRDARRSGYRVLALTNWSAETFPVALRRYPFLAEFEGIVVSGREHLAKPDAAIFELLMRRHDVTAERAVFLDDSEHNVAGAQAVGMHAIHFTTPRQARADLIALGLRL